MVETNGATWRRALASLGDVLTGNSEARDRSAVTDQILAQALSESGHSGVSIGKFRRSLSEQGLEQMSWAPPVVARTKQIAQARLTRNRQSLLAILPEVDIGRLSDVVNTFCYKPYLPEARGYDAATTVEYESLDLVKPFLGQDVNLSETGRAIGKVARQLYDTGHIKIMRRNGHGYIYLANTIDALLR